MAKTRELLRRRKGVQNTKKITRTMELISTAKLKKISNKIIASRPYMTELTGLVKELLKSGISLNLACDHSRVDKVLVLTIASNRGLCGAYNVKVADRALKFTEEQKAQGREVVSYVAGKRVFPMFLRREEPIARDFRDLDDRTPFSRIKALAQEFIGRFVSGDIDKVYVVYSAFLSRARQGLEVAQLLPIPRPHEKAGAAGGEDYLFEPSPEVVLSEIAPLSVEIELYRMFMEAMASEQAYRMRTMKSATENAENMLKDLTRQYNRARQTQITMELLDILGGAGAI